jgi:endo-alpha-1,4-polygalactosaminidase (GH114 family)
MKQNPTYEEAYVVSEAAWKRIFLSNLTNVRAQGFIGSNPLTTRDHTAGCIFC